MLYRSYEKINYCINKFKQCNLKYTTIIEKIRGNFLTLLLCYKLKTIYI